MKRRVLRWSGCLAATMVLGLLAVNPTLVSASDFTSGGREATTSPIASDWMFIDHFQFLSQCIAAGENEAAPLGLQWMCVPDQPGYSLYVQ